MKNQLNIRLYPKRTKNQEATIMLRIRIDDKICEISTKIKTLEKHWSQQKQCCNKKSPLHVEKNALLKSIHYRIEKIYFQLKVAGESITPLIIKDVYNGKKHQRHMLVARFKQHNSLLKRKVGVSIRSKATFQKYQVTLKHLQEYIRCAYNVDDVLIPKVNYQFICGFELHLRTAANCGHNTMIRFQQLFKRIILLALEERIISKNPFANYKMKKIDVKRTYLSMEELQTLMAAKFSTSRLTQIRDIFIFACFTGLSYIDVCRLKHEDLCASFDGELWIRTNRQKTKEFSNIKLLDIPKRIIEKYAPEFIDSNTKLLPVPSNQKVNAYLKEIADICGIHKKITYHVARHTMATTIALSNGLPIESLARVLGHSNIRTTQLYAKVTDMKLNQDMTKLNQAVKYSVKSDLV